MMNPVHGAWEITRDQLTLGETLGYGVYGRVCKGVFKNELRRGKPCAIYTVEQHQSSAVRQAFLAEAEVMKKVGREGNEHVVQLYGVVLARAPFHIVTELMDLGNVRDFLRESRGTQTMSQAVTLREMMNFMEHTAYGLQYLLSQGIVHKSLTAKSVLLNSQHVCKVSDYGRDPLAHPVSIHRKWMAPECVREQRFSANSVVWAFGMTMWEIATLGATPYYNVPVSQVVATIEAGKRPPCPPDCPETVYRPMQSCWDRTPTSRPSMEAVIKWLQNISGDQEVYNHRNARSVQYLPFEADENRGGRDSGWDAATYATGNAGKAPQAGVWDSTYSTGDVQDGWDRSTYATGPNHAQRDAWDSSVYQTGGAGPDNSYASVSRTRSLDKGVGNWMRKDGTTTNVYAVPENQYESTT